MTSIIRYFYRKDAVKVILLLVLAVAAVWAQKKQAKRGPRATALVIMAPDGKSAARLIPICIRDNDQFWDASIYQAAPRPMALEPGTVYEVERTGNSIGFFTVAQAVQETGVWIGLGKWKPYKAQAPSGVSPTSDDERPVLRRSQPSQEQGAGSSGSKPQAKPEPPPAPPEEEDADRPVLKRGKPSKHSEPATPPSAAAPIAGAKQGLAGAKAAAAKSPELVPAISDAGGPDPRPFTIERNADDEARLRKGAAVLAEEAILKQAGLAAANARVDYKEAALKYFDLDGNNSVETVLTARVALFPLVPARRGKAAATRRPPTAPTVALREFFVTFIARENLNGELQASFGRITDIRNVDLDGRLELIDAADVDGDGRGELLFRRRIGKDVSYLVLKVGLSQTTKLFDSAGE